MKLTWEEAPVFLVEQARRRGAGEAEAYLEFTRQTRVQVNRGRVEELIHAEEAGVGLRVLRDGATGFSFSATPTRDALEQAVERAWEAARVATPDVHAALPDPEPAGPEPADLYDSSLANMTMEERLQFALEQEAMCFAADPRVKAVAVCRYEDQATHVRIVNSRGVDHRSSGSVFRSLVYCTAAVEGKGSMGLGTAEEASFDALSRRKVAGEAVRKALVALEGRPPATGVTTVVFEPWAVLSFLPAVVGALSGENVQRGQSMFTGRLGEHVACELVNLVDDGLLPGRPGSSAVDGEGVPRRRTPLIAQGVLQALYHNVRSARRAGKASTGNARRASYRGLAFLAPSNACLLPGDRAPAELIAGVDRGVLVTSFTNTGGVNGVTGDFSVAASGRRISGGELAEALDPFTIGGNLLDMLGRITGIGNDLVWYGSLGAPTVRIEGLTVAGKG